MNKEYSQEELDQILLSKKLNEFYLAIIENRQELLSDEEYEEIVKKDKSTFTKFGNDLKDYGKLVRSTGNNVNTMIMKWKDR